MRVPGPAGLQLEQSSLSKEVTFQLGLGRQAEPHLNAPSPAQASSQSCAGSPRDLVLPAVALLSPITNSQPAGCSSSNG